MNNMLIEMNNNFHLKVFPLLGNDMKDMIKKTNEWSIFWQSDGKFFVKSGSKIDEVTDIIKKLK